MRHLGYLIKFTLMIGSSVCLFLTTACQAENLVVVVNIENTITEISRTDLINIYMGRSRQFANGEKAAPIDNRDVKGDFYVKLVDKTLPEIKSYWARLIFSGRTVPPQELPDNKSVVDSLLNNKDAIAYIPESQVSAKLKVVYVLKELKQ